MMIARVLAFIAGGMILAAVTHVQVIATGGYGTPHSYLTLAVAAGVGFASVFTSMAWDTGRRFLAALFMLTIVAGEAFNLLATAERLIVSRETAQKPLLTDAETRAEAEARVTVALAAVKNPPTTSPRLERTMAAKAAADAAVVDKSAERGCRENCRQLLQAQADAANLEVANAQAELVALKAGAVAELAAARAALERIPKPASATPLADRVGIAAWIIDLVTSALGSVAANGLACCLLIFGAHHRAQRIEVVSMPRPAAEPSSKRRKACPIKEHAAEFAVQCLQPGGEAPLEAIDGRYLAWRGSNRPFPRSRVGKALADLFDDAGLAFEQRGDQLVVVGVSLTEADKRLESEKAHD